MMFKRQILDIFGARKKEDFDLIEGYDDAKEIVNLALDSKYNYNLLFQGPPGSAKTLFLLEIQRKMGQKALYFDGSNTTNRILDELKAKKDLLKCVLIDEIDKMSRAYQVKLLNFLENGHVKVDQQQKQFDFTLSAIKVFATSNDPERLIPPFASRFKTLHFKEYAYKEFENVAVKILHDFKPETARHIAYAVWYKEGSKDVREILHLGKLIKPKHRPEDIERIIETLIKYGAPKQ